MARQEAYLAEEDAHQDNAAWNEQEQQLAISYQDQGWIDPNTGQWVGQQYGGSFLNYVPPPPAPLMGVPGGALPILQYNVSQSAGPMVISECHPAKNRNVVPDFGLAPPRTVVPPLTLSTILVGNNGGDMFAEWYVEQC